MANSSESGHAVNVSNYKLLIDRCASLGPVYNPNNTNLTIVNMTAKWTTADTANETMITALQGTKQPINARELLFAPVDKLVTRIIGALNSSNASKNVKQDAKGIADKIRGVKTKKTKITPDEASLRVAANVEYLRWQGI